jgi:mutator protein MutT
MTQTVPKPHLQVTAAVILRDDLVLLARRQPGSRHGGRWEFPGGKREPGETLEECLVREIVEELALVVTVERRLTSVEHDYGDFSLTLHAYICRTAEIPDEGPDRVWVRPDRVGDFDLLPPDRKIASALTAWADRAPGKPE